MIIRLDQVSSTMTEAAALLARGYGHGTAVVAEEQTGGMGRHGHAWYSEPGSGLYVSVIIELPLSADSLPVLTLALGLAAADAIAETTGLHCDLRWPNDVMLSGKKAAGILVQLVDGSAIAGIGINVNHSHFPRDLAMEATSLRSETGEVQDRERLLTSLLASVERYCGILVTRGKGQILKMFAAASSYAQGKPVKVDLGERKFEGVTTGLDDSGFLIVRKIDGSDETVLAGGVRPA